MNEKQSTVLKTLDGILTFLMLLGFGFAVVSAGFFLENSAAAAGSSGEYDTLYFGNASHFPITLGALFFITVLILAWSDKKLFPDPPYAKFLRYMALSMGITFLIYSIITIYLFLRFLINFAPEPEAGYPFISLPFAVILTFSVGGYFLLKLHFTRKIFYAFMFAFFTIAMALLVFSYLELFLLPCYSNLQITLPDLLDYNRYFEVGLFALFFLSLFSIIKAKRNLHLAQTALLFIGMWACASTFAFITMTIYPFSPFCNFAGDEDIGLISFVSLLTAFIILWILIIALQKIKRDWIRRTHDSYLSQ